MKFETITISILTALILLAGCPSADTVTATDIATVQGFSISVDDQNVPPESTFPVTINNADLNAGTDYVLSIEKKDGAAVEAVTIDNNGRVSISSTIGTGDGGTYTVKAAGTGNYTGEQTAEFRLTVKVYIVGDTGPAGGIIFYVNTNADSDGWTYLEAAPSDFPDSYKWGNTTTEVGKTGTAIGTGESNTAAIVAAMVAAGFTEEYAAKACADYTLGGKDDWFLPSRDELNELHKQRYSVGGFPLNNIYWSSSEASSGNASMQNFSNFGNQFDLTKANSGDVRAVRAF